MEQTSQPRQTTETHLIDDPNYYFFIDTYYYEKFQSGKASLADCVYFNTFQKLNDDYNDEEQEFETFINRFMKINMEEYKQMILNIFSMKFYTEEGEIPYFQKVHDETTDSEISNTRHSYESKLIVFEPVGEVKKKLNLKKKDIPFIALEYSYYDYYEKYTDVYVYEAVKYKKTVISFKAKD